MPKLAEQRLPRNVTRWIVLGTLVEVELSGDRFGPIRRHELLKVKVLALPHTTIDDHLRTLVRRGTLVSTDDGFYEFKQFGNVPADPQSFGKHKKLLRRGRKADMRKWLPLRETSVELDPRSLPRHATRRMILGALVELSMRNAELRPVSRRELLEVLPLSATTVGERLSRLYGEGMLTRPGRGLYELKRWATKKPAELKYEEQRRLSLEKIRLRPGI